MKAYFLTALIVCSSVIAFAFDGVPFTLRNNTAKSIPLRIPGVMNPNLSPFSNSGVDLAEGQKIFFYHKRKKYLLLEVTPELANETLIVNKKIAARKKELGLD